MIIVVGGIKGGSGKTTICTNLVVLRATLGRKVLLVDADEQKSASDWVEHRLNLGISSNWTTIQLGGKQIGYELKKLQKDYHEIYVDTGGRDTTSQRSALTAADIFLTPFQPRSLDIWTLGTLQDMVSDIVTVNPSMKTFAVINRADAKGSDNEDAKALISNASGINLVPTTIGQRKTFSNAAAEGMGIFELQSLDSKATKEFIELSRYIFDTDHKPKKNQENTKKTPKKNK